MHHIRPAMAVGEAGGENEGLHEGSDAIEREARDNAWVENSQERLDSGTEPRAAQQSKGKKKMSKVYCQVAGCTSGRLAEARTRRVRTCVYHQKAHSVEINGHLHRFCQRCATMQPLEQFHENQHSCRQKLELHNSRRRQRRREKAMQQKKRDQEPANAEASLSKDAPKGDASALSSSEQPVLEGMRPLFRGFAGPTVMPIGPEFQGPTGARSHQALMPFPGAEMLKGMQDTSGVCPTTPQNRFFVNAVGGDSKRPREADELATDDPNKFSRRDYEANMPFFGGPPRHQSGLAHAHSVGSNQGSAFLPYASTPSSTPSTRNGKAPVRQGSATMSWSENRNPRVVDRGKPMGFSLELSDPSMMAAGCESREEVARWVSQSPPQMFGSIRPVQPASPMNIAPHLHRFFNNSGECTQ